MCLVRSREPDWEEDIVFANRRHPRRHSHTRVSETIVAERRSHSPRPVQYVQAPPRASTPIIRPVSPPRPIISVPPPQAPPAVRLELVSVEEDTRANPRGSRVSVSKKSRHGSRGGEEVYIERERERVRLPPVEKPRQSQEYDTYRYVEGTGPRGSYLESEDLERRRSRSITYETNPRVSGRVTERERVVIEDDGRRREYYRRP